MTDSNVSESPLSSLFNAYSTDALAADKAAAERDGSGVRNLTMSKLDPGAYDFRFLPPPVGQTSPFLIRHTHFVKGGEKVRAVPCARLGKGERCLVCEEVERLEATGNATDAKVAADMDANFSVQAVVLDLALPFNPAAPTAQLAVLEFKKTVHTALMGIRANVRGGGDFTHPVTGFPIAVTKSGAGMNTDYKVGASMAAPRGLLAPTEAAAVAILQNAPDIFAVKYMTDDEVNTILAEAGMGGEPSAPPARGAGGAGAMLGSNFGTSARTPR
jgi:hypothetical protein